LNSIQKLFYTFELLSKIIIFNKQSGAPQKVPPGSRGSLLPPLQPGFFILGVRCTPDQTDSDVTCSRSCDQGKITKKD